MNREKLIEDMARGAKALKAANDGVFDPVLEPTQEELELASYTLSVAERAIAEEWRGKAAQHVAKMSMTEFFGRDGTRSQDNAAAAIRALPLPGDE